MCMAVVLCTIICGNKLTINNWKDKWNGKIPRTPHFRLSHCNDTNVLFAFNGNVINGGTCSLLSVTDTHTHTHTHTHTRAHGSTHIRTLSLSLSLFCLCLSICLSVYLSVCLSLSLSFVCVSLSVCLSLSLSLTIIIIKNNKNHMYHLPQSNSNCFSPSLNIQTKISLQQFHFLMYTNRQEQL